MVGPENEITLPLVDYTHYTPSFLKGKGLVAKTKESYEGAA